MAQVGSALDLGKSTADFIKNIFNPRKTVEYNEFSGAFLYSLFPD